MPSERLCSSFEWAPSMPFLGKTVQLTLILGKWYVVWMHFRVAMATRKVSVFLWYVVWMHFRVAMATRKVSVFLKFPFTFFKLKCFFFLTLREEKKVPTTTTTFATPTTTSQKPSVLEKTLPHEQAPLKKTSISASGGLKGAREGQSVPPGVIKSAISW